MTVHAAAAQVPYWVAVLTPEERPFGTRRTDPRIDTVFSSAVTSTRTQWVGAEHPSETTLLAVLAATVGSWQSNNCRSCTSGVLVDVDVRGEGSRAQFPVRLPSNGDVNNLVDEVRRRVVGAPNGGADFAEARSSAASPALTRRSGAQISFRYGFDSGAIDENDALTHSLSVACEVVDVDGVTLVDTEFRWNSRVFTRTDVDDFERFWEKTLAMFV